jgi:hypothetical protein
VEAIFCEVALGFKPSGPTSAEDGLGRRGEMADWQMLSLVSL